MDLRNNRIHELPNEICSLANLVELKLDYNFLQVLPQALNKLKKLKHLSASQNSLKTIPQNAFLLEYSLEFLILNDNKIASVPAGVFDDMGAVE